MKVIYDAQNDILRILFSDMPIEESDEAEPGMILDYDEAGAVVGIEILDASARIKNPHGVEYAVVGL